MSESLITGSQSLNDNSGNLWTKVISLQNTDTRLLVQGFTFTYSDYPIIMIKAILSQSISLPSNYSRIAIYFNYVKNTTSTNNTVEFVESSTSLSAGSYFSVPLFYNKSIAAPYYFGAAASYGRGVQMNSGGVFGITSSGDPGYLSGSIGQITFEVYGIKVPS